MASGILLRFRCAPLHVLRNLPYSAFFVAWLVCHVLTGAWAGAGLWVGQAYGVFYLPGFGLVVPAPPAPEHPTSICNIVINGH